MKLSDLLEDGNKDLVIIYPGRFHPFHIGHGKVYKYLKQKYSNAKVFISTSGKVDGDRSPFTFEEKRKMMILAGVSSSDIVQTKSPYQSIEIMERFDKDNTVVVFAVSEKDMAEDPRFDFSNGLKLKKNGEPAYLQKWNSLDDAETFGTRGYIATTPTFKFKVLGQEINSASQIRNMIAKSDDTKLTQMLQDLYSVTDVPQDIIDLFKNKVGNKETMNENWDEHSFSKFLKENVIEDNIMKKGILTTITEGKSPHKKGTKKYNAHMAAMHAESVDEEFDRKVKKILLGKKSMKTNEWVQEPHEGQKWSGQEKNFIHDLCKRHDGIQMQWPKPQTGADGIKGPSPLWDKGNIMSNDADLQKLLSWVEKNKHDVESYFKSDFRVYSNKDKGQSQSDGNQVLDNIRAKIGSVEESKQLDEVVFLAPWILPAVATAIRFGGPPALAALRLLLKGGSKAAPKIVKTGGNLVQKSTGTGIVVGAVGKTIYDKASDAYEGIKNWFKLDMDEDTIKVLAQLVVKYGIPLGGIAAILYGGKQLKDYMSGEEEEKGNTTINNYYNKSDDKPVAEASVLAHGGKGQYKAVTDGGVVRIMHKGKEIASGDFDSGADGWFVSRDSDKGQKFFGNAQDMVDHFVESYSDDFEYSDEYKEPAFDKSGGPDAEVGMRVKRLMGKSSTVGKIIKVEDKDLTVKYADGKTMTHKDGYYDWTYDEKVPFVAYESNEVKEWIAKAENDLGREITNEEKAELNEFWPQAAMALASRVPPATYASVGTAIGAAASKAGKWIKSKLKSSVDPKLKEDYANDQHEKLEYIHSVLQECGDGNMDITMVEQAIEYVEDIREQHFDDEGNTKSESVNEEDVTVDNAGNIAGYLDTIDEYVLMMFQKADGHAQPGSPKLSQMAYRIQNAVDDIRSRELGLNPSNLRAKHAKSERPITIESTETVNEHEMSLLGKVARQMEADAHSGDYTAIEELLHNVSEEEMEAFLSDHRSDDFDEGVMGTIGQGIDNAVVGTAKLIKKGVKAASPHVKKAAKDGVKKISKIGSKNTTTSFDGKGGSSTSVAYNEDGTKDVTPAGYGPDDYDEKDVPPEAHGGDMKKMQDLYRHNEDRNNHSGNIEMLAQAFGNRDEVKAIEGLMKIIKRQGHVTSDQNDLMYNAIHKKYYSQLFSAENEGNAFSGELAKAKIDGKKNFDVDGKTYKVKEALSRLIDKQKMK